MCVQYWPAGKNREEIYSGVGVTVENEEQLANFMIRTIRMRKVRNSIIYFSQKFFHQTKVIKTEVVTTIFSSNSAHIFTKLVEFYFGKGAFSPLK